MYAAFSLILRAHPAHQLTAASALAITYRTPVVDFMQACDTGVNGSELDWERKDRRTDLTPKTVPNNCRKGTDFTKKTEKG
jgi:hypothetical protein